MIQIRYFVSPIECSRQYTQPKLNLNYKPVTPSVSIAIKNHYDLINDVFLMISLVLFHDSSYSLYLRRRSRDLPRKGVK